MGTRRTCIAGIAVAAIAALFLCSCGSASAPPSPPNTKSGPPAEPPPVAKSDRPSQAFGSELPPSHHYYSARPAEDRPPTDDELLAESLDQLKKGNLAYSTPEKMKMGQTERVTARIGAPEVSLEALKSGLSSATGTSVATAATPISARMKMELKSADFDITPLSSEEQAVGGSIPTAWEWDIAPKHSGTLRLHLAAVVELKNLSRDFTSIDRDVTVRVDPVDAVSSFMTTNWQWIIATLTAIGGAGWKFLKSRKKPANPDSAAAAGQ
ncbi:MAG TPA: hypothetical protein VFT60_07120 [Bryobacteraceae bacterium]|nr:hypothetical protein [Bryobacteraceae bacterium]